MTGKRRRRIHSHWMDTLQEHRSVRKLSHGVHSSMSSGNSQETPQSFHHSNQTNDLPRSSILERNLYSHSQPPSPNKLRTDVNQQYVPDQTISHESHDHDFHAEENVGTTFQGDFPRMNDYELHSTLHNVGEFEHYENDASINCFQPASLIEFDHGNTAREEADPRELPMEENIPCRENVTQYSPRDQAAELERRSPAQVIPMNVDMDILQNNLRMWKGRLNLTAILAVVGSVRYTVDLYEHTRELLRDCGSEETWPPYSRTQKYFATIVDSVLPKSALVKLPKKISRLPPREHHESQAPTTDNLVPDTERSDIGCQPIEEQSDTEEVRIFFPSEWAKLDISTPVVFNDMFPSFQFENHASLNDLHDTTPLDETAIVQERDSITNSCDHIFVESNGQNVQCQTGSVVDVRVFGTEPSFSTSFRITSVEDKYSFLAGFAAIWSVGAKDKTNPSFDRAKRNENLTSPEKTAINAFSTADPPRPSCNDTITVYPGDICTLLRPAEHLSQAHQVMPIILHRYWRYEDGHPRVILLWARSTPESTAMSQHDGERIQIIESDVVEDVVLYSPSTVSSPTRGDDSSINRTQRSYGRLADGTKFVVYRILLYCDDFQKSAQWGSKGSAGGCYFLPLSLPAEKRRNTSSVRIISLTPPGVSTNDVLHFIASDRVAASVQGVEGHTPNGEKLRIFVDVLGFVGDYPASSSVIDVLGHTGRAPCTHCSFRRLQETSTNGSKYGYTTSVHSRNSSFLRHGERHQSLRNSMVPDSDTRGLGMVENVRSSDRECPLLYFQRRLESNMSRAVLRDDGEPVIPGNFDAYRCNFIAADHLLTGLSKDILNAIFISLPTAQSRKEMDIRICAALRSNELLTQREVFNVTKKSLNSMTLSEIFCVLVVSLPVLEIIIALLELTGTPRDHIIHDCFSLLRDLQTIIAFTYWWPDKRLDGQKSVDMVRKEKNYYFSDLRKMSKGYVQAVDRICRKSDEVKRHLDKPNLHRLLELYEHTIPAVGHVREVMELVFESAHQPLKRCIARSNNRNAHIYAVEHCAGNDWQGRLAALSRDLEQSDEDKKRQSQRGIRRLLLGEEANLLCEDKNKMFIDHVDRILGKLFTPAISRQFKKDSMISNFQVTKEPIWKARGRISLEEICCNASVTDSTVSRIVKQSVQWIQAFHVFEGQGDFRRHLFSTARRVNMTDSGRQVGKPCRYDTVYSNCCVQVQLDPSTSNNPVLISSNKSTSVRPFFFAVLTVLEWESDFPWAICFRCTKRGDFLQVSVALDENSFHVLRMTPDVRRIALYHICHQESDTASRCKLDENKRIVIHNRSLLDGARFFFQCRVHGCPPRMA